MLSLPPVSCLGWFVVVPYSFHIQMLDLTVLSEMLKAWDIFYRLTLLYTSRQTCLVACLLVVMLLFVQ